MPNRIPTPGIKVPAVRKSPSATPAAKPKATTAAKPKPSPSKSKKYPDATDIPGFMYGGGTE